MFQRFTFFLMLLGLTACVPPQVVEVPEGFTQRFTLKMRPDLTSTSAIAWTDVATGAVHEQPVGVGAYRARGLLGRQTYTQSFSFVYTPEIPRYTFALKATLERTRRRDILKTEGTLHQNEEPIGRIENLETDGFIYWMDLALHDQVFVIEADRDREEIVVTVDDEDWARFYFTRSTVFHLSYTAVFRTDLPANVETDLQALFVCALAVLDFWDAIDLDT